MDDENSRKGGAARDFLLLWIKTLNERLRQKRVQQKLKTRTNHTRKGIRRAPLANTTR